MFKNVIVKEKFTDLPNEIKYGSIETPDYGKMFTAYYEEKGQLHICSLYFARNNSIEMFASKFQKLWPKAKLCRDDELTNKVFAKLIEIGKETVEVYVILIGTDFQLKVWSALLKIPFGEERTYGEIAEMIGNPKSARAVGNAVGSNNIVLFIPCHRVRANRNDKYKYGPGSDLKKKILMNEQQRK